MSNQVVSNVYRYVIDDVITQMRGEFEDMGIDEAVLQELQRSWETKVARSRVADFGFSNEGYEDEEGDRTNGDTNRSYLETTSQPTVANLAALANSGAQQRHDSNIPTRSPHQTHTHPSIPYSLPPPSTLPHLPPVNGHFPPMHLQQQPYLPDLHLPGGRPNIPQNDGTHDMTTADIDAHLNKRILETLDSPLTFSATTGSGDVLDMDHLPDHIKLLMKDARKRAVQAGAIRASTRIAQLDGEDQEEDAINSDLDDTDDDDDDPEGGEEVEHIILCLYDKVTRTKNKWKCVLKDGIMLVNGRDYLFHRGNGDFEW